MHTGEMVSVPSAKHRNDGPRYLLLTMRSVRLLRLNAFLSWPSSIWTGVTVENTDYPFRANHLRRTSAIVKFLSLETLLGPIRNLDMTGIDWVGGGESGPGARFMDPDWVQEVREMCVAAKVPFVFKQWAAGARKLQVEFWTAAPGTVCLPLQ